MGGKVKVGAGPAWGKARFMPGSGMPLTLDTTEADRLARELAQLGGETMAEAVTSPQPTRSPNL
jgi:hypothetical protein